MNASNLPPEHMLSQIRTALDEAPAIRDEHGDPCAADALKDIRKILDGAWAFLPGKLLSEIAELDVPAMVDKLVTECAEIDIPDEYVDRIEIVWKSKAAQKMGKVTCGTLGPVGKRERLTYAGDAKAPWWRMTLALDVWCLMTEQERWRLVHHELMHATTKGDGTAMRPAGRGHDVEDFAASLARYGIGHSGVASTIAQAMARPKIVEELREYDVDPTTGQGLLFKAAVMAPVGW